MNLRCKYTHFLRKCFFKNEKTPYYMQNESFFNELTGGNEIASHYL